MTAIGRVTVRERKGEEGDSKRVRGVRETESEWESGR